MDVTSIQEELQAALTQENADTTTHATAISKAIADLAALSTVSNDPIVSLVGTTVSGAVVHFTAS